MLVMTAPIRDDVADPSAPLSDAHMAEQQLIATLLVAARTAPLESDRIAYDEAARLIETHAAVATDDDYPQWAAQLAALPTYYRAKEANR